MQINLRTRHIISEILLFTFLWMIIMHLFFMVSFWGMRDYLQAPGIIEFFDTYFSFYDILFHSFTFGLLFSVINVIFERSHFRKLPLGKIIILKSIFYLFAVSIADTLLILINAEFLNLDFKDAYVFFMDQLPKTFLLTTSIYYTFFILLLNFIYQVNKKIGSGILLNNLIGKYHHPRDEHLIFLFLDMKNSTGIAERLEHKKYSMFIKDCFSLLTNPIYNCRANVYQFVGDEAVLNWKLKKGIEDFNCLKLYFEFSRVLENHRSYFMKNYGVFPEFKAGIDYGEVTVTEVGEIRRDLAYHGDVLNTAARLEKLCKKVGHNLLISEYLDEVLPALKGYRKSLVNSFKLEGKDKPIKVFAIEESER